MSIKIKNLKKYIGERLLIDLPELTINEEARVGIVGENGSGKTTLLNLIARKEEIDEGQIIHSDNVSMIGQFLEADDTRSGGEQTKEKIRKAVQHTADILLADEPTNHLDQKGREYLIKELKYFKGCLLIVSHDRDFLNQMCEEILEIDGGIVRHYSGNYDDYLYQKEIEEKEYQKKYQNYVKEKERLTDSMQELHDKSAGIKKAPKRMGNSEARLHKRGKGQAAKKALSKQALTIETRLEKLEVVDKPWKKKELSLPFSEGQKIYKKIVIEAEKFDLKIEGKQLLSQSDFRIKTGERTALIGPNGSGKTTLLKAILAYDESLKIAKKADFSYFSQSLNQLEDDKSMLDNVQVTSNYEVQVARDLLAHLLFRGTTINKKVAVLSGGERTKVAIAKMILGKSNVLILDEPTNHLDIKSLKVLEEALKAYRGTIIFVSHDRYFVNRVADTVLEIKNRKIIDIKEVEKIPKQNSTGDQKMVLEMRKTSLLSQLAIEKNDELKDQLDQELLEIMKQLKLN